MTPIPHCPLARKVTAARPIHRAAAPGCLLLLRVVPMPLLARAQPAVLSSLRHPVVLSCPSHRFPPFFDKARFVYPQDALLLFQMLYHIGAQLVSDRLLVPVCCIQEALHSLRATFVQLLCQLPPVLAFDPAQQASEEPTDSLSHFCPPKVGPDPCMQCR